MTIQKTKLKKLARQGTVLLVIATILAPFLSPLASAQRIPQRYNMVAILVEDLLYSDTAFYDGLTNGPQASNQLLPTTIKARVDRYATDIQNDLADTRAVIIRVDQFDTPQQIAATLERLYFDGDPLEPDRTAYLKGVVIVGDVPLPVVNKEGNRFISVYPYTDFAQKAYVWDRESQDFRYSAQIDNPQPEIWHGVITSPLSTKNSQGKEMLAAYLDKNHLWHLDDPTFTRFDQRVFFQDFVAEKKNFNKDVYKHYLDYIDHWGDISYYRYTKELYRELFGAANQDFQNQVAQANNATAQLAAAGIPVDAGVPDLGQPQPPAGAQQIDVTASIPDIQTKISKQIDNLLSRFRDHFSKYPNELNDLIRSTGRYSTNTGLDAAYTLITTKDEYTREYLRSINDMVERQIDALLPQLEQPITIWREATLNATAAYSRQDGSDYTGGIFVTDPDLDFYNHSTDRGGYPTACISANPITIANCLLANALGLPPFERPAAIYGTPIYAVTSVEQCSPYRGTLPQFDRTTGARLTYGKLVEINKAFNTNSAIAENPPDDDIVSTERCSELDPNERVNCNGWDHYAGCFYGTPPYDYEDPSRNWCFPEYARNSILDPAGTRERRTGPQGYDDFRSCFQFYEQDQFDDHLDDVEDYLDDLEDPGGDDEIPITQRRLNVNRAAEVNLRVPMLPPDKKNEMLLINDTIDDDFDVTLGHVMRGLGFTTGIGGNWQQGLNDLLRNQTIRQLRVPFTPQNHPFVNGVDLRITRDPGNNPRTVTSLFFHKEPTNQTLNTQVKALIAESLPVDDPRYITFQDRGGNVVRIDYPDLYKFETFADFQNRLRQIELQINALPQANNICNSCLSGLVTNLPERTQRVGPTTRILRANNAKIADGIRWKEFNLDAKHSYMLEYYLDSAKVPYVAKSAQGYELAYFNGDGDYDGYSFSIAPPLDAQGNNLPPRPPVIEPPQAEDDGFGNRRSGEGYDLISFSPPPLSPWWERMQEWFKDLKENTVVALFVKKRSSEFYGELADELANELARIKEESAQVENDPRNADEVNVTRVKDLLFDLDSSVVTAGRKVELGLRLVDGAGKPVLDEVQKITLTLSGAARFAKSFADDDPESPGAQITIIGGVTSVGIVTDEVAGAVTLEAKVEYTDIRRSVSFQTEEGARLNLQTQITAVVADGGNQISVDLTAVNEAGNLISDARTKVLLGLSDSALGTLSAQEITLSQGRGQFTFQTGRKAGGVFISATSTLLDPTSLQITLLPGPPRTIGITAPADTLITEPGEQLAITAMIFDQFGNLVDTNSALQLNFAITPQTAAYGTLDRSQASVARGQASVNLLPRTESGFVDIEVTAAGLPAARMRIKTLRKFSSRNVAQMDLDALTVALLGIPAGDVTEPNFFGGWFMNRGRVQAVTTLTTPPKLYQKLIEIQSNGSVVMPDAKRINASFVPANNLSMVFRDEELGVEIAQMTIVPVREGAFEIINEKIPVETLREGIYLRKISPNQKITADRSKGALRFISDENEIFEVQTNGFMRIFDSGVTVAPGEGRSLTLAVLYKGETIGEVIFVQEFNQDVVVGPAANAPGVYVEARNRLPQIQSRSTFTGSSSSAPRGIAFFDRNTKVENGPAPGFPYRSLEDSLENFGVGFTNDNKFGLLFSGGEIFGEANRQYASDIGIVLGDPTIKIDNRDPASDFSKDVGRLLYAAGEPIREIVTIDYNTDGFEDILVLQGDGKVRLLQNNGGFDALRDMGFILNIKNGIQDFEILDFNNDGRQDLLVAGFVSCRKGDTCLDVYENVGAAFVRRNLRFNQTALVTSLTVEDLNLDGFVDILFGDAAGDIKAIYNRRGVFEQQADVIGNVGFSVDSRVNLTEGVLLRYPEMAQKNASDPRDQLRFKTLSVQEPNVIGAREASRVAAALPGQTTQPDVSYQEVERDFIYADLDAGVFSPSTKFAVDLNGGVVAPGDRVRYTLTLVNRSSRNIPNVMVSDPMITLADLDEASLRCTDCGAQAMRVVQLNSSDPARSLLFTGITVPSQGRRTITYDLVYRGDTQSVPKLKFIVSRNFADPNAQLQARLRADRLPDFGVTKEGNPTGQIRYYYSTRLDANGKVVYQSALSSPPDAFPPPPPIPGTYSPQNLDLNVPLNPDGTPRGPPAGATAILDSLKNDDKDGDGLQDSIDNIIEGGLDGVENSVRNAVSSLTCSVGCLPLPINAAFLSPGPFSMLGAPVGYDLGLPVFGWGAPSIIPFWPPTPHQSTLGGRFYVSPAITGGVGFSLCLGPWMIPQNCFSFGINILDLLPIDALCESIQGAMTGVLSTINSGISKLNEGLTLSVSGGAGALGSGGRQSGGSGFGNYSLGSYQEPTSGSRNISIPGFPSIITDWLRDQINELINAATDVPDVYIIYPDTDSLVGSITPGGEFPDEGDILTNVLTYINSIPLIDVQTQEVDIKVPIITRTEIERWKQDARTWIDDTQAEIDKFLNTFCITAAENAIGATVDLELCRFVEVDLNGLISSIQQNMKALDEWVLFPKQILQFRAIEALLIGQVIDYIDTIIEFTGGWVQRNTARVRGWRRAIRQIRETIETWSLLIDLMIDFNESCDKCKTERFSLMELVAKIFLVIPRPPVIPMPHLPDIILDVSKIRAGLTVQWPDVQFRPVGITLPKLPRISLSAGLPNFKLSLPSIPVIPAPPKLPAIPELPQLNLPRLPDLPPAPTIPALPGAITATIDVLKQILRIYCLIKLGFIPTSEFLLKPKIEEITARGLTPLLPIDLLFQVEPPTFDLTYVDAVKITGHTNLQLDFSGLQRAVEGAADEINSFSDGLSKGLKKATREFEENLKKLTQPKLQIGPEGVRLNYENEQNLQRAAALGLEYLASLDLLSKENAARAEKLAQFPKEFKLEVEEEPYVPNARTKENVPLVLPMQKRLKEYRDRLASNLNSLNGEIERGKSIADLDEFGRYLAAQKSPAQAIKLRQIAAAPRVRDIAVNPGVQKLRVGKFEPEDVKWAPDLQEGRSAEDFLLDRRLIAQVGQIPQPPDYSAFAAQAPGGGRQDPSIYNRGIFYIDTNGQSKRLINYQHEADSISTLANIDVDNDRDTDKLYTYGANLYFKENNRVPSPSRRIARPGVARAAGTFRQQDIEFWTLRELAPRSMSANYPTVNLENVREAAYTFTGAPSGEIAAYEVVGKDSPAYFEAGFATRTLRTFLIPQSTPNEESASQLFSVTDRDGNIYIDGALLSADLVSAGATIRTDEDAQVELTAPDGTTITIDEETVLTLKPSTLFELTKGRLDIEISSSGDSGAIFSPGTVLRTLEGSMRIRFSDGSSIELEKNKSLTLPKFSEVSGRVLRRSGQSTVVSPERQLLNSGAQNVKVKPGEVIHALEITRLLWNADAPGESSMTLSPANSITVPDALGDGVNLRVSSGTVEILKKEVKIQPVEEGMMLSYGDRLEVTSGSAVIQVAGLNNPVRISRNEIAMLEQVSAGAEPSVGQELEPGFYFQRIHALDAEGNRGNASETFMAAPQVCGDESPPFAKLSKARYVIAVGKTFPLDASQSFDGQGNVISYWLDTDTAIDTNADGIPNNDRDLGGDSNPLIDSDQDGFAANDFDIPRMTIGPYQNIGTYNMRLTVRDEALNEGYQDIVVEVIEPRIVLNEPPLKSNIISGYIEPPEENAPISIARLRPGPNSIGWELLTTPSADPNGQYFTDRDGNFSFVDLDQRDRLVIKNQEGKNIAEINRETGRIKILDERYEKRVLAPAPITRIGVFAKTEATNADPLSYVYYVPDTNVDVALDPSNTVYDRKTAQKLVGVHLKGLPALSGSFRIEILSGDDAEIPGAAAILNGARRVAAVDINGDIFLQDSSITLTEKPGELEEPVVFELRNDGTVIAEVYIATVPNFSKLIEIVDAPKAALRQPGGVVTRSSSGVARGGSRDGFSDVDGASELGKILKRLKERGIVAGVGQRAGESGQEGKRARGQSGGDRGGASSRAGSAVIPAQAGISSGTANLGNGDDFDASIDSDGEGQRAGGKGQSSESLFEPGRPINRAEFTQVTLKALCIVPREEAHRLPSPFHDVLDPTLWFYPVLKEGNIRGFIRGYLGEKETQQGGRETTPFKPANSITRAEAATVILAALNEQNIIDLSRANLRARDGEQWYDPYIRIAQNITPYLVDPEESKERRFIVTSEEAQTAADAISRADFALMVNRVLLITDCYGGDGDGDGLPDLWEYKYTQQIKDLIPNDDPDGDQCTNRTEYENRTNPFNRDTDGGGTEDCVEINAGRGFGGAGAGAGAAGTGIGSGTGVSSSGRFGTNPLSPYDDNLSHPDGDPDGDGCTNTRETQLGTDPFDPDTDNGGTDDCDEADGLNADGSGGGAPTDPLNVADDRARDRSRFAQTAPGIYIIRPDCGNVCPCRATIGPGQDLQPQDIIFAALTGPRGVPIYAKSNEATY